jgi:hypothetical protein
MPEPAACVEIVHSEVKIGDTLCVLPLVMQLASLSGMDVHVTGAFAGAVKPLVPRLPIRFDASDDAAALGFRVDIQAAYDQGRVRNQHMAESISRLACLPVPALPVTLDLAAVPTGLPPGIVLAPFSGSRNPWYKAWPLDRWLALTRHLVTSRDTPVYVPGAADEDAEPFAAAGAIPLPGLPLPVVLHLMRQALLFISIDNGLSHLAHFGDVRRHVLLYPALLPPNLVVNPRARVLRGRPEDIGVAQVIRLADAMIGAGRVEAESQPA